jgi:hypothetical protein
LTRADIFAVLANIRAGIFSGQHLLGVGREAKKRMVTGILAQQATDNRALKNLRVP